MSWLNWFERIVNVWFILRWPCAVDGTLKSKNYIRLSWVTIGYSDTRELGLLIWISPFCHRTLSRIAIHELDVRWSVRVCDTGVFLFLVCIPPEVTVQLLGRYNARTNFFCRWPPQLLDFQQPQTSFQMTIMLLSTHQVMRYCGCISINFVRLVLTPMRRPRSQKMGGEENIA